MAEVVKKSKLAFLKFIARVFASALSLFGVLTSCGNNVTAPYGVEGVYIQGRVVSASDSKGIQGIEISVSNLEATEVFADTLTQSYGDFFIRIDTDEVTLPDSIRLTATDIDGEENGSFIARDTLLSGDGSQDYYIDFSLQEANE